MPSEILSGKRVCGIPNGRPTAAPRRVEVTAFLRAGAQARYVIHDRETESMRRFDEVLRIAAVAPLPTAPHGEIQ